MRAGLLRHGLQGGQKLRNRLAWNRSVSRSEQVLGGVVGQEYFPVRADGYDRERATLNESEQLVFSFPPQAYFGFHFPNVIE
ncbi:MAG: hypothetical protein WBF06_10300, partial [Candidatus Acidiferrales bacterium]